MNQSSTSYFLQALQNFPDSYAAIQGSEKYPQIHGTVYFYQVHGGTLVLAEVIGLPVSSDICKEPVFGFHIHEGISCTGDAQDPFKDAKAHYNPRQCEHPYHAGDLPPLFGNSGFAWMMVFTDRFSAHEVIGRTVIIHHAPDDMHTHPSGNSGEKIACGIIQ